VVTHKKVMNAPLRGCQKPPGKKCFIFPVFIVQAACGGFHKSPMRFSQFFVQAASCSLKGNRAEMQTLIWHNSCLSPPYSDTWNVQPFWSSQRVPKCQPGP